MPRKLLTFAARLLFSAGYLLSLAPVVGCKDHQKKLQIINDLINNGNKNEADEMIRAELLSENKKHIKKYDAGHLSMLQSSPGARTSVWVKDEIKLVLLRNGKKNEMDLGGKIKNVQLAPGGKFALALSIKAKDCKLSVISLLEKEIVIEIPSCDPGAAVTGDGQEVLYSARGGVGRIHLKDGQKTTEDLLLDRATFAAKFAKLTNRFFVVPDPSHRLFVFYGAAGQYRLYLFASGQNIMLLKDSMARPQIYFPSPEPEMLKAELPEQKEKTPSAFAYSGNSGKYRITPILEDTVPDTSYPAPTIDPFQMTASGRIFFVGGDTPAIFNPVSGKKTNLPLRAKDGVITFGEDPEDQGILYIDLDGNLQFRRDPFTDWEKDLQAAADRAGKQ